MDQETLALAIAILIFLLGYAYLNYNGTYWLNKNSQMSKFTNLYYVDGMIFVENREGKEIVYNLTIKRGTQTLKSEVFNLLEGGIKNISFFIASGERVELSYTNKTLKINPAGD